jgi:hypothetical protein
VGGFFYNLGRFLGRQSRKANWAFRSLTGTEADAVRAEWAVGRDLAQSVLEEVRADPDPAVARWLGEVGGLLARGVGQKERAFAFRAVLATEPNAFALPGGFVFVSRALLRLCQGSHDDLAFVLGHEMGHVVCGHAMERLVARSLIGTAVGRWNPAGGLLRGPLAGLMTTLLQQGYSQDQELEADRVGAGWPAGRASTPRRGRGCSSGCGCSWPARRSWPGISPRTRPGRCALRTCGGRRGKAWLCQCSPLAPRADGSRCEPATLHSPTYGRRVRTWSAGMTAEWHWTEWPERLTVKMEE